MLKTSSRIEFETAIDWANGFDKCIYFLYFRQTNIAQGVKFAMHLSKDII